MTLKEFAKMADMDYQEVVFAVSRSDIWQYGRRNIYKDEDLRRVMLEHLGRRKTKAEKRLTAMQRSIDLICGMKEL